MAAQAAQVAAEQEPARTPKATATPEQQTQAAEAEQAARIATPTLWAEQAAQEFS